MELGLNCHPGYAETLIRAFWLSIKCLHPEDICQVFRSAMDTTKDVDRQSAVNSGVPAGRGPDETREPRQALEPQKAPLSRFDFLPIPIPHPPRRH